MAASLPAALDWITGNTLPLGESIASGVDRLTQSAPWLFDAVSDGLSALVLGFTGVLLAVPPLLMVGIFAVLAFALQRSLRLAAFVGLALLLIVNMGYWTETMETLSLVLFATLTCVLIGVPIGIAAAHRPWLEAALRPLLDLMQTIPTFVYLIPTLILFGLGVVPGLISTVIFALPAPIRLTTLGVASVPRPLIEAGQAIQADIEAQPGHLLAYHPQLDIVQAGLDGRSMAMVGPDMLLEHIIHIRHATGRPVLLCEAGQFVGVVGDEEIYRGMLQSTLPSAPPI